MYYLESYCDLVLIPFLDSSLITTDECAMGMNILTGILGTWNLLRDVGIRFIYDTIRIFLVDITDDSDDAHTLLELGAGRGFMASQLADFSQRRNWKIVPLDPNTPYHSRRQYCEILTMSAIVAMDTYWCCRMFLISRGEEFMLDWLRAIVRRHPTDPLLLILASDRDAGPSEFYELLDQNKFVSIPSPRDSLYWFPNLDKDDELLIYRRF